MNDSNIDALIIKRMKADALLVCRLCRGGHREYQKVQRGGFHFAVATSLGVRDCAAFPIYAEIKKEEMEKS